jgi:hypothetical protein
MTKVLDDIDSRITNPNDRLATNSIISSFLSQLRLEQQDLVPIILNTIKQKATNITATNQDINLLVNELLGQSKTESILSEKDVQAPTIDFSSLSWPFKVFSP